MYYSHLIESIQKKCCTAPAVPQMETACVSPIEEERVQELQTEVDSLRRKLETTQEDVRMLQADNSR